VDALFMAPKDLDRFLLRSGDLRLLPAAWSPTVSVLDQEVTATDLALTLAWAIRPSGGGAVVVCHVDLQQLGVCAGGGLPSGLLGRRIEVVRKVLGVGMANLPSCRKTGFYLWKMSGQSMRQLRKGGTWHTMVILMYILMTM
jgi:hypothetical protein